MFTLQFWEPVIGGVVFLLVALVSWVRGKRRRSLVYRWQSWAYVAFTLCAGLTAVEQLPNPLRSDLWFRADLWFTLQLAAWFLGVGALVVALVHAFREEMQRGSGMRR
ncbi:MAG: hypothetical protein C5B60_00935 [Chloroflexi bacterium]|nr:MAG: hypothetical protein C5B60_00935 [Chloroflexota bacterium]